MPLPIIDPNEGDLQIPQGPHIYHAFSDFSFGYTNTGRVGINPRRTSQCCICGTEPLGDDTHNNFQQFRYEHDDLYCERCYANCNRPCAICRGNIWVPDANDENTVSITSGSTISQQDLCERCYAESNTARCDRCERLFFESDIAWINREEETCLHCLREVGDKISFRHYEDSLGEGTAEGNIVKSLRKFGIELEVQWPSKKTGASTSRKLKHFLGVQHDGSIQKGGFEVQTPPANGAIAENVITEACSILRENNFKVDMSCGFHVHIDVSDIFKKRIINTYAGPEQVAVPTARHIRDIWLFYMAFEDVITSFLPSSRRGGRYCNSLRTDYHFKEIESAGSVPALESLWYRLRTKSDIESAKAQHRHDTRYRGINLHPLFSGGHIEIRYHSGTISPRKIFEWVNLHCRIIDEVIGHGIDSDTLRRICTSQTLEQQTSYLFNILGLSTQSVGYFRARQSSFYEEPRFKKDSAFKSGMEELEKEEEK